jgi:hypothetical protein
VLGTPPAFVLSQDQTLRREPLDPAVKAGFGFVFGKSASPSSTPGSAFLWCSFVRPSSRQARRTAPPEINGVNALAFGTLFSSQGASADPKEGTPKNGVARPTMVGTQTRGVNRTTAPNPTLLLFPVTIPVSGHARTVVRAAKAGSRSGGSARGGYTFGTRMEIAALPAPPRFPLTGSRSPPL